MPRSRVYLIRHGQSGPVAQPLMLGHTDLPLSRRGGEQIKALAQKLAPEGIRSIYSSPLLRCRQSAEILARAWDAEVRVEHDWREINLGEWDGLPHELIKQRFPVEYARRGRDLANYRPPGGESFSDLAQRVLPVFFRLTQDLRTPLALVGHAGVHRVLLCSLLGMPLQHQFHLVMEPGTWTRLEIGTGLEPRLSALNRS
jgi:broad specificity phosphatase PhoE